MTSTIAWSDAAETEDAIDAAQSAFKTWSRALTAERATALLRMAAVFRDDVEQLGAMLTSEQGKPLAEALAELLPDANYVQWFGEEARRINGERSQRQLSRALAPM